MTIIRIFLIFFFLILSFTAHADPVPLGIELNKTTLADIKKQYTITDTYNDEVPGYKDYYIETSKFSFDGLTRLGIVCDDKGIIRGVILYSRDNDFNKFYKMLEPKYKLVKSKSDIAKFEDNNNEIILSLFKHEEIRISISYRQKEYAQKLDKALDLQQSTKQKHLQDML